MPQLDIITYFSQYMWLSVGLFAFATLITVCVCYQRLQASEIRSFLLTCQQGETKCLSSPTSLSRKVWLLGS